MYYNGANSYLVINGTEIIKFKAKDTEIVATPLCLGNVSKDLKKTKNDEKNWIKWMFLWFYYLLWCYCSWWYIRHSQVFNEKEWGNIKC